MQVAKSIMQIVVIIIFGAVDPVAQIIIYVSSRATERERGRKRDCRKREII